MINLKLNPELPPLEEVKAYTGIGNREVEQIYIDMATALGYHMASLKIKLLSGNAVSMDDAFQQGAIDYSDLNSERFPNMLSILPRPHFNGAPSFKMDKSYIVPSPKQFIAFEKVLIKENIEPKINKFPSWLKRLFLRNVGQVLGLECDEPVDLVIYAARETPFGVISGGTRIAVYLARKLGIACFNLKSKEEREVLFDYIGYEDGDFNNFNELEAW